MSKRDISFTFGERLKELRQEQALSHVDLAKRLAEEYGISISRDSLMAYEIADEYRSKSGKLPNLGMRAEYLFCLADFYGVSMDYLMGRTNIRTPNLDARSVCEKTGLAEGLVRSLIANESRLRPGLDKRIYKMKGFNEVIRGDFFVFLMRQLTDFVEKIEGAERSVSFAKEAIEDLLSKIQDGTERKRKIAGHGQMLVEVFEAVRYSRLDAVDRFGQAMLSYALAHGINDHADPLDVLFPDDALFPDDDE